MSKLELVLKFQRLDKEREAAYEEFARIDQMFENAYQTLKLSYPDPYMLLDEENDE